MRHWQKGFFYWPLARGGEGGGKEERIFQCGKKRGKGKKKKKKKTAHEDEMLAGKSGFFGFFFASTASLRTPVAREASEGGIGSRRERERESSSSVTPTVTYDSTRLVGKGRREKEEGRERGPDDWAQSCTLFVCLAWGGGGRDLPRLNLGFFAFFSCPNFEPELVLYVRYAFPLLFPPKYMRKMNERRWLKIRR